MVRTAKQFAIICICMALGFFVHDYVTVKQENFELQNAVRNALDISDRRGVSVTACMVTLASCTRLIDNPQMFRQLQKEELLGFPLMDGEVASGTIKQGSKGGMGPGGKGGVETSWKDARKGSRD